MSKFVEDGFLSTETESLIKQCHSTYKEWFDLFEELNRYCWEIVRKLKFNKDNKQEYISYALFVRMLGIFEGSYFFSNMVWSPKLKPFYEL